ncbi:hypothetical protein BDA99DRAFT_570379 [Phascolomyces articulosus]|uniref:NodB homology domain-containing protein n=1 Tax=Phascolomyces articulosus TaxID=60185 RepID=A0AAD5PGI0_9FUNG|nr:hypothetical protein BDA99DRAFT_570379 [Phascolomyces articulosus]
MLSKLVLAATLGFAAVNAQSTFQFSETFPEPYVVPQPKQAWLDLISNATISNAPIIQESGGVLQQPSNVQGDPNCVWTFTQCLREDDLHTCPVGKFSVTFDDGPSEYTPKLLDYLDSINEKVTFFVVGGQVIQYPEILKRAYDAGHEIAMHTWSHSYMTTLTNEQLVAELKWTEQAVFEVTGHSPKFIRPPFGNIDDRVRDICKALGFTPVIWSVDTNDWYLNEQSGSFNPDWINGNVTQWASTNTTSGGMSLSHDLYNVTVDAALEYLPILSDAFDLETVGQCNNQQAYKEGAGNVNGSSTAQPSASTSASASDSDSSVSAQDADDESSATRVFATGMIGFVLAGTAAFLTA